MRFLSSLVLGTILIIAAFSMNSLKVGGSSDPGIIINEIMYDPDGPEVEGEWVELWNSGTQAINIKNWTLSDQDGPIDLIFPDMEFPSDAYALVHAGKGTNSTAFVDGKADFYMWRNSYIFPPSGDDVVLANDTGVTMDFMSYGQWDGFYVDAPPADFPYTHSSATAEEGFSIALVGGVFRQSIPTPLEHNREDVYHPLLITEVYYCPYPGQGEYVTIHNPLESTIDISFWYVTDLEGIVYFPTGTTLAPGESYLIAQNSTSYYLETLKVADFEYDSDNATISDMTVLGTAPQFTNAGDEVLLMNNYGTIIDAFVYGDSNYSGAGWASVPLPKQTQGRVAKRNLDMTYEDTNTSTDWQNLRQYRIAQSDFQAETFTVDGIRLFTSPDSSFGVITDALDSAQTSILLNIYEFTNTALLNKLIAAIARGVDVKVFLEGAPVGGANRTELYIARQLVEAGGQVRHLTNDPDNDIHQRYAYDHAKYLVLDNQTLLIMSENWGRTGIPETGKWGNRGWGARMDDAGLAGYFTEVFYTDWEPRMKDSVAFDASHPKWDDGMDCTGTYYNCTRHFVSSAVGTPALVTPVIAPDTALSQVTILGMLANAQARVCVEQFYIYKHWGNRDTGSVTGTPNIYLEAVIDAARRGCEVRVLLDASSYNTEPDDPIDNDDTVDYVNGIAQAEDLNMTAKLVNMSEHDFTKIHNKGLIADDAVLISSINWNLNSVTENREAGLIIDNQEVAGFFMEVFEHDWADDLTPPVPDFDLQDTYLVNEFVEFNASTSSDNVGIVNYTWQLDDVETSHDVKWMQVFDSPANHTVELRVADAWGNTDNLSKTFSVVPVESAPTVNNTENGTETNNTDNTHTDDSTFKIVGILLLVPIAIFIALLWVVKVRER